MVRPYKTRTAFTNLTSSPLTIYLNEYLIDDEEVIEYLLLRELIHIKLHMYPSKYGGGLSYAEKFDDILHFFMPKEKVEEIREKMEKRLIEVNMGLQRPLFSPCPFCRALRQGGELLRRGAAVASVVDKRKRKKGPIRLQVRTYRCWLTGLITPVRKYLQVLAPQAFSPHSGTTSATNFT